MNIKLIAGLGNIGYKYHNTRHNFGSKYIMLLSKKYQISLHKNNELFGFTGSIRFDNNIVRLLIPNSYMNNSGIAISKCVILDQLSPEEILIVHDELDLLPGKIRIKLGNRLNDSHRGVKDIVVKLHNKSNFYRLRIGIGRPDIKKK